MYEANLCVTPVVELWSRLKRAVLANKWVEKRVAASKRAFEMTDKMIIERSSNYHKNFGIHNMPEPLSPQQAAKLRRAARIDGFLHPNAYPAAKL